MSGQRATPMSQHGSPPIRKRAVVGVICRGEQLLAIRRSPLVAAPGKICFPGGGMGLGESEEEALVREIHEELALPSEAQYRLHESTTSWGTWVGWWLATVPENAQPIPRAEEVAEWFWMRPHEMLRHPDLLSSNRDFLTAWRRRQIVIPGIPAPAAGSDSDG